MLRRFTLTLITFIALACFAGEQRAENASAGGFESAELGDGKVIDMLPGIVEPARRAQLSAPLAGVLMQILVKEGDKVEAGQVVAVLDNRVAKAQLRVAEFESRKTAALARAKSELTQAETLLSRLLSLEGSRAVSPLEIDQATATRDSAMAALADARERAEAAKRTLELARARLELHNIYAPFRGQVLRLDSNVGETVNGEDALVHLADLNALRVELHVPIELFRRLRVGETYKLAASHPINRVVAAQLDSFEPVVDAATQTFRCIFRIDNSTEPLVAGFAVRLIHPDN